MQTARAGAAEDPIQILVVEDDDADFDILRTYLGRVQGLDLHLDRVTRLESAEQQAPTADLILLDLGLPDSSGPDTARRLLALDHPGVIIMTGLEDEEAAKALLSEGAVDYLPKGDVDLDSLERSLRYGLARRRAARALVQRETEFRAVMDHLVDAVVSCDTEGLVRYANPATQTLFGWRPQDLIDHPLEALMPPRYAGRITSAIHEYLRTGDHEMFDKAVEVAGLIKKGPEFPVELSMSAYPLGNEMHFTAVLRDITDRKQVQLEREIYIEQLKRARAEADRANAAKSTFLANISHEIRTPMNAVIATTDLLLAGPLTPEQERLCTIINRGCHHLMTILNDVLDLSKIEAGRLVLDEAPMSIRDVVRGAADLVAPEAHRKGLELTQSATHDVPDRMLGDAARLRQVLVNLLANAVKFTDTGEVHVGLEAPDPASVVLRVEDTGPGVDAESRGAIFQAFHQATGSGGGTGLGLAISRRLVEAMGGSIRLEPSTGRGACFQVTIPVVDPQPYVPAHRLDGTKVAVICHHDRTRRMVRSWLQGSGAVLVEGDGEDPDAWVVDLPPINHQVPDLPDSDRPILALVPTTLDARTAPLRGSTIVHKPVQEEDLLAQIQQALDRVPAPTPKSDGAATTMKPLRVLLAEDDAVNREVIEQLLSRLGHQVDTASDGADAIEKATSDRYDVVFLDLNMPKVGGLEAGSRIRAAYGPDTPILALTADAAEESAIAALEAGLDGRLLKPVTLQGLATALERFRDGGAGIDGPAMRSVIASIGQQKFADVVRSYEEQAFKALATISQADHEKVLQEAHRLKGASRTIGASQVAGLCAGLEDHARAGRRPTKEDVEALERSVARTIQAYHDAMGQVGSR